MNISPVESTPPEPPKSGNARIKIGSGNGLQKASFSNELSQNLASSSGVGSFGSAGSFFVGSLGLVGHLEKTPNNSIAKGIFQGANVLSGPEAAEVVKANPEFFVIASTAGAAALGTAGAVICETVDNMKKKNKQKRTTPS